MDRLFELAMLACLIAAPAVLVWQYPVRAAIAVLAYLAFEEAVLLIVPSDLYAAVRLAPEALLVLGAVAAWHHGRHGGEAARARLLWPEMTILVVAIIGVAIAFVNDVSVTYIVIGLRWLFRYAALYSIWRLAGRAGDRRLLVQVLCTVVVLQATIGIAQSGLQWIGIPILDLMQASSGSADLGGVEIVTGGTRQELGQPFYVFGTLGRYHRFGIFIAAGSIVLTFLLVQGVRRDLFVKVGLAVAAGAIVLSTSRQALLLVTLTLVATAWLRLGISQRVANLIRGGSLLVFTSVMVVVTTGLFTAALGDSALMGRLLNIGTLGFRAYYLAFIVPNVLASSSYLGLGAGTFGSRPHVMANAEQYIEWGFPGEWALQFSYDSEWAILLGQYGVPGFLLFYAAMVGFGLLAWRAVRLTSSGTIERVLLSSAACLSIVLPILGAVGAELGSRTTACVVWSVIGASVSWILEHRHSRDVGSGNGRRA